MTRRAFLMIDSWPLPADRNFLQKTEVMREHIIPRKHVMRIRYFKSLKLSKKTQILIQSLHSKHTKNMEWQQQRWITQLWNNAAHWGPDVWINNVNAKKLREIQRNRLYKDGHRLLQKCAPIKKTNLSQIKKGYIKLKCLAAHDQLCYPFKII